MYLYMYFREIWRCRVTVGLYKFQREMASPWHSYFLFIYIFHLKVTFSLHVFYLCYIGKTTSVSKTSLIIFFIYRETTALWKLFYCVFIIVSVMTTSWSPIYKSLLYLLLLRRLFSWRDFILSQFSMGLFCWWVIILLHAFNNLHACLTFHTGFVSNLLEVRPKNVTLVNL